MKSKRHPHGGKRTPGLGKKLGRPLKYELGRKKYSISLDPALMALLEVRAQELDLSRSEAVNAAVSAWLHLADTPTIKPILQPIRDKKEESPATPKPQARKRGATLAHADIADLLAELPSDEILDVLATMPVMPTVKQIAKRGTVGEMSDNPTFEGTP